VEYKIRQKIFSFGDKFAIKDMNDRDMYYVHGKIFTIGNKLRILDLQNRELVYIEQKIFRFLPEYHIYMNNVHVAMVKREFSFFRPKLYIESDLGRFDVDGSVFAYDFNVRKNGRVVATVSKKFFSWTDTYKVSIDDGEDQVLMLALVIVLDQIFHDNNNNSN